MQFVALGAILLAALVWLGRQPAGKRREWRFLSGAFGLAALTGAAFSGLRGLWVPAIILALLGLWLLTTTRINAPNTKAPRPQPGRMSQEEARSILGVGEGASAEEIQAAYTRLMRLAHPDKGGTTGLAAQLNAARDRLLRR